MAIRLLPATKNLAVDEEFGHVGEYVVRSQYGDGIRLVQADTLEEAEQAKRAFELVLAPRFTRDEAIAIVLETMPEPVDQACEHYLRGIRLALEALAAAGVFVDPPFTHSQPGQDMTDRLDAAGIR